MRVGGRVVSLLCAWCGAWIRKESPVGMISHGLCRSCGENVRKQLEESEEGEVSKPCRKH